MNVRRTTKFVHVGSYVAAVEVDLIDSDTGWSPYLSLQDGGSLTKPEKRCAAATFGELRISDTCLNSRQSQYE